MTPDEFRTAGKALIDWIADYWERVEDLPVQSDVAPGDIRAKLPEFAPESPESWDAIVADLDEIIVPGLTNWQSPNWFAFFPGNVSEPSVLGELLSAGLGQQGMNWATSPVATELESHVLDWMVDLLGLPQGWKTSGPGGGVIQTTASDSTHAAIVAARERAQGSLETMTVYTSSQAHSSVEKGAKLAGISRVRLIEADDELAMDPAALERAIEADIAAGLQPMFVCSTVGTTGTTAVDPVRRVGEIAQRHNLWHHVDAAYAGSVMICPEFRHHQDGLELADSYVVNPHKWMFTNLDCSLLYVADKRPLVDVMSIMPPYLRNKATDSGDVIDYRDYHVALGRRFRALKLWFVLRTYGAEGIREVFREHVRLATVIAAKIDADPRFELLAPHPFGLVTFRHVAGAAETRQLAEAVNDTGRAHWTVSELDGVPYIRIAVGQTKTEERHVTALWDLIDKLASHV